MNNIRNFVIISHIDHGKSTLADRFLEFTGTVETRQMKPQYLDRLESERERGITIKMAPVRMKYKFNNEDFILNLIDTPGHSDFSYEVSRALAAVEGAVLLVDATQGIQAQTLSNFRMAQKAGLKIIGAINKIDLADEIMIEKAVKELAGLIGCPLNKIHHISGKTGKGVDKLLESIVKELPAPRKGQNNLKRALVFDSLYDEHKGVIAFVRIFDGEYQANQEVKLVANQEKFKIKEIGCVVPEMETTDKLAEGEIGYIATGIKEPDKLRIGDTIGDKLLAGYKEPKSVIFVSLYPDNADEYDDLKQSLKKLKLNDYSLNFEPDFNEVLGRGFKVGFLGQLHFEITAERLEKEFRLETISTFPSVDYHYEGESIYEPMIKVEIITQAQYFGGILQLKEIFRWQDIQTDNFEDRILITVKMPLSGLISDFDSQLKSVSEGMASFSYELTEYQKAPLIKAEILVAGDVVPGLTRMFYKDELEREGRRMLKKLKEILPHQQFVQSLQVTADGRIIARENIPAMRKDVTGYLYGGDRTRKMKLWKKQKRGKQRLKATGRVTIPSNVFKELLKK